MTTLNLPYRRWVAQVSTGAPRVKSAWISMMQECLTALQECPWREAADVPASLADHDFTKPTHFSDACDAFKMTGNYNADTMVETGYAGMSAYRFKIPDSAQVQGAAVPLQSVSIPVSRDRYLKGGVRIAVELTDRPTPSADWATVRSGSSILAQDAAYLMAGCAGGENLEVDVPQDGNPAAYLWVYVTLEDYTDRWGMYSATEQRLYAIEGSAMLTGGSAAFTFAGDVSPDSGGVTLLEGGSSPTWLQPLPTQNVGATPPDLPPDPLVETFYTGRQTKTTPVSATWGFDFITSRFTGRVDFTASGSSVQGARVTYSAGGSSYGGAMTRDETSGRWLFVSPFAATAGRVAGYLVVTAGVHSYRANSADATQGAFISSGYEAYDSAQMAPGYKISGSAGTWSGGQWSSGWLALYDVDSFYLMLRLSDGVPVDADMCDSTSDGSRRNEPLEISGAASPWTVSIAGEDHSVSVAGSAVRMSRNGTTLGAWTSSYGSAGSFFDPSVSLRYGNQAVADYGLAPVAADFSAAVATFEMGTQPGDAEILGRLARMSKAPAGEMLYLHPASGALAGELDALRPVPRFYRVASPPEQTECQPGLSVWYRRPPSGSTAARGFAYDSGVVSVVKVTRPPFLQYAFLALRSPAAFRQGLRIANAGSAAVGNAFALRFAVWRCDAGMWDGGDAWGLAALASMPSIYQDDEDQGLVSWSADLSGNLMPLGSRSVSAERIGLSPVVEGDIAAGAAIYIPVSAPVSAGDVVLVAPVVLGFAPGGEAASATFGRQADPSSATAASHGYGWARYPENLGWFPRVTGI